MKIKQLIFNEDNAAIMEQFTGWLGHRAIGVVYDPEAEHGNYVPTRLTCRYDAFLYIDKTQTLHPLHLKPSGHFTPDLYPFGI